MCGNQENRSCCPDASILQEEICGRFGVINEEVWIAPIVNDYIQGTFEVFNSGPGLALFTVHTITDNDPQVYIVPPGNSLAVSVNNPTKFIVQTADLEDNQASGKWCIKLYKRVFE